MEAGAQDRARQKAEGSRRTSESLRLEPAGLLASLCHPSPLTVVLNAIATPLASLPVARVLEGLGGLWGTLKDTKSMPKASLKIALVHPVSAVPGGIHQRSASLQGAQSRGCPSPLPSPLPSGSKVTYSQMP